MLLITNLIISLYSFMCMCEGCGGQHCAFEGARSGCSGAGEEPRQQSNLRPQIFCISLQVNTHQSVHLKCQLDKTKVLHEITISAFQDFGALINAFSSTHMLGRAFQAFTELLIVSVGSRCKAGAIPEAQQPCALQVLSQ